MSNTKLSKRKRVKMRVRKKIRGTSERPRLSVFRSNNTLYAQIIDDSKGVTLAADSSADPNKKSNINVTTSKNVGKNLGEKVIQLGLHTVVFDRNGYRYHGNVKALAEGAREVGLKF